jgi:hypothetical protein
MFLEEKTGISNGYLSQIETGYSRVVSPLVLRTLAKIYSRGDGIKEEMTFLQMMLKAKYLNKHEVEAVQLAMAATVTNED